MKKIFFLITFIIISIFHNFIYSQNEKIDSLLNKLSENEFNNNLGTYLELAKIYTDTKPDSTKKYCNLIINSKTHDSLLHYKSKAYLTLGNICLNLANHEKALDSYLNAVTISEKIKDSETIIRAYNNISVCYYDLFDYDKSQEYLLKCLELIDVSKSDFNKGNILNNLGLIAHEKEDYDNELNYYKKALLIYNETNDSLGMAMIIANIAIVKRTKGEYELALKGFFESLNYFKRINSDPNVVTIDANIGITYLKMKDYKNAKKYFDNGFEIAKKKKYKESEMKLLYNLSLYYKEINNYKTSLEFLNKYYSINDSLFDKDRHKQVSELNIKYKTFKKDKEILLLNKDKIIQEELYSFQEKIMYLLSLIITIIILFAIAIFYFNKRQFSLYKNLVKKNIELLDKDDIIRQNHVNKIPNSNITKEQKIEFIKDDSNNAEEEENSHFYSKLDKDLVLEISSLITKTIEEQKIYLDNELTITKMAEQININRTYLSQIINGYFHKNFSTFINEYRIKDAQKKLLKNSNITIEGISKEVGFKSKSAFNTAFKNYTGVTPSFFIKNSKTIN